MYNTTSFSGWFFFGPKKKILQKKMEVAALSAAAKFGLLLHFMNTCVAIHIDDESAIIMNPDQTLRITSRVLNGLVRLRKRVVFSSVKSIQWDTLGGVPFHIEKFQLFPSLEFIECGRAVFFLTQDMSHEIPFDIWCPLLKRIDFADSRAAQHAILDNRFHSTTVYVKPSPTIEWFRGNNELRLATCDPVNWPLLRELSLWINNAEYAALPPVRNLDVYSPHEDVELPAFDKSNLEIIFLSRIDANIVGECANLVDANVTDENAAILEIYRRTGK